jgi:hypothetical protein
LPVAPVDVDIGRQVVELRKPLITRGPGVRLILYVRDARNLGVTGRDIFGEFESAAPLG